MNEAEKSTGADEKVVIKASDGIPYNVTAEGSIGMLALGAVGLKAWRIARIKAGKEFKEKQDSIDQETEGK